jgi:hypothetical protein
MSCLLALFVLTAGSAAQRNCSVVINADKQSNIYVTNQKNLGGYNAVGGNNIETVVTPCQFTNGNSGTCLPDPPSQAYYSTPAYWFDGSTYWLYAAATMNNANQGISPPGVLPEALNAYQLQTISTTGPITQTPYANSGASNAQTYPILFCDYAPTPSVSSNPKSPAGSGIVWAIEEFQNKDNNPKTQGGHPHDCAGSLFPGNPGALHAFCAEKSGTPCPSAMTELYSSRTVSGGAVGAGVAFKLVGKRETVLHSFCS